MHMKINLDEFIGGLLETSLRSTEEALPPTESGGCSSYAVWPDDHREYCTRAYGHKGMHEKEFGGPGAWWADNVYRVGS